MSSSRHTACVRIHGAILDGLRANDFLPRSVRSKARTMENATSQLEHELGRSPTIEEVADRAEITVAEVHELKATLDVVPTVSLSTGEDEGSSLAEDLADPSAETNIGLLEEHEQMLRLLARRLAALTGRERDIAILHHAGGGSVALIDSGACRAGCSF
ncbi:MAG TPA: sigma-70 domain-containing protein [Actinomycetes bacterium]|jgi:RNA polymerase sigma factor FliA|nr:sigma-70 domain-containing protein [Actinomycetes bacterium]